jgi:hypothetical protein
MALIADEANLSQEGKLNVLGAFDRIAAPAYPTVHPKMVFVFRIEAGYGDGGKLVPVRIRLMDDDGQVIFEAGGEIMAPEVAPGDFATAHQIFTLVGAEIPRPGVYKFVINLGDLPPHETQLGAMQTVWAPEGDQMAN